MISLWLAKTTPKHGALCDPVLSSLPQHDLSPLVPAPTEAVGPSAPERHQVWRKTRWHKAANRIPNQVTMSYIFTEISELYSSSLIYVSNNMAFFMLIFHSKSSTCSMASK